MNGNAAGNLKSALLYNWSCLYNTIVGLGDSKTVLNNNNYDHDDW